jgi:P-type conjugative transfer protein TrbG
MTRLVAVMMAGLVFPGVSLGQPSDQLAVPGGARRFAFVDATVFPVIAMPGRITDIILEPGEALVGSGPVAAGDTARWVIGDTISGAGEQRRVHVMIKPTAADLATNLIINTDRRTYHLELRASSRTWLSQVSWRYEAVSAPVVIPAPPAPMSVPAVADAPTGALNLAYRISGDHPLWRPARVFDDGRRVFIEFAPTIDLSDLPPLYRVGPDGKTAELINYHVEARRLVVDRLFDRGELRLGGKRHAQAVRLTRLTPLTEAAR